MNDIIGRIFDIQRFAIHDGPGIRTTVFMKGCSNGCMWCHNPESVTSENQLQFFPHRCINCGNCVGHCQQQCHHMISGEHSIDRTRCTACGLCVQDCHTNALIMLGKSITIDETMEQILADITYYRQSGGGVTLSGGEPVLQNFFCLELLKRLKEIDVHTALQTAGNYDYFKLKMLLPYTDLVMYDVKGYNWDIYQNHIGGDRNKMLENLKKLDTENIPIIVRTPVIGSVNDTSDEIMAIVRYVQSMKNLKQYVLFPYHALGKAKYDSLGKAYINHYFTPESEAFEKLQKLVFEYLPMLE